MSNISWTEQTWNPIVGCSIASSGCKNCYAMAMAARLQCMSDKNPQYDGTTKYVNGKSVWTGKVAQAPESILMKPLKRKKPTIYFVNSMGDLFHEDVPDEWINEVFSIMAWSPQHTFQVLTKRAERMKEYITKYVSEPYLNMDDENIFHIWPLPNVWLGVSAENQEQANKRIPHLLDTPAAIRFVSLEPQLSFIRLDGFLRSKPSHGPTLDWVIQGCESGPGARDWDNEWARLMRKYCKSAYVPYFLKQIPGDSGQVIQKPFLDGVQHLNMPEVSP